MFPFVTGLMRQPVDTSEIKGEIYSTTIPYDYLVYAVGAEVQTFNIPGVKEHACFMKELGDAERVRFSLISLSMAY
jgi:NADH:ubiquinone reductase (non-electrogenic)